MLKKILSMILVFTMVMSTGCSFNSDDRALEKAVSSFIEAENYSQAIKMNGTLRLDIDGEGENVGFTYDTSQDLFRNPLNTKLTAKYDVGGEATENQLYIVNENDKYNIYRKQTAGGSWSKMELNTLEDAVVAMDYAGGWDFELSDNYDSYAALEDETLTDASGASKTYMVRSFKISSEGFGSQIRACALATGNSLGVYKYGDNIVTDALKSVSDKFGDVTVKLYIDRDEKSIYKIDCDLKEIIDKFMTELVPQLSKAVKDHESKNKDKDEDYGGVSFGDALEKVKITAEQMSLSVNYTNIDSLKEITVPDEAKAASSVTA